MPRTRDREIIDGVPHIRCGKCRQMKPADEDHFSPTPHGPHNYCRPCNNVMAAQSKRRRNAGEASKYDIHDGLSHALTKFRAAVKAHGIEFPTAAIEAYGMWMAYPALPATTPATTPSPPDTEAGWSWKTLSSNTKQLPFEGNANAP